MEDLKTLRCRLDQQQNLQLRDRQLKDRRAELERKIFDLRYTLEQEQADVEKLERPSLGVWFQKLRGSHEDRLEQERQEVYAAQLKLDAARKELASVGQELEFVRAELLTLAGCREAYDRCYAQKARAVKESGSEAARRLLEWEAELAQGESRILELQEAIWAGKSARSRAQKIQQNLDSAVGYSAWDVRGGGLVADLAKHTELDEAQDQVVLLQIELRKFQTELADVRIGADLQVNIQGFDRFADYFFDGIFADWAVREKIQQSQGQVRSVQSQIDRVLGQLEMLLEQENGQQQARKREMENLIVEAKI